MIPDEPTKPNADAEPALDSDLQAQGAEASAEFETDSEDWPEAPELAKAEAMRYTVKVDARHRLDKHLQQKLGGMSRNQVQRLIALGGVTVNGKPAKPSLQLKSGHTVEVWVPPKPSRLIEPEPIPLEVLYEDEHMIVVNKDAGIMVHPARSTFTGTMLNALAHHLAQHQTGELSKVGNAEERPGVVHRLDRFTTGVILFAKRDASHWLLARQWEHRTNLKAYLAVVHGCPDPPSGAIEAPLGKHPTIREAQAVRHDSQSRDSLTLYRVRERYRGYSLVEFELKTGRTHQIRVHSAYIGFPLVGDLIYGGEGITEHELEHPPIPAAYRPNLVYARPKDEGRALEQKAREHPGFILAHPALHAAMLQIDHPESGKRMTFTAPLHEPMRTLVRRLREQPEPGPTVQDGTHVDLDQAVPRA